MQNTNYIMSNEKNEALKLINKIRLTNKNKWYFIELNYNNKIYQIKAFNTWLQIFRNGDIDYSNCMDQSIKQYKEHILNILN
jgi:hypothetical protein